MKQNEVTKLLAVASTYQKNIADGDPETLRDAWYMALDMRMTVEEGVQVVVALAAENTWISPGSINEKFLARYRKSHEQGTGKAKLPGQAQPSPSSPAPLEVGSAVPVKPQEVPEYWEKRGKRPKSWDIKCPYCGAKPGAPCTVQDGKRKVPLRHRTEHPARAVAIQVVSSRSA